MSAPNQVADFGALLEAHGVPILSRSGREVRIAAAWRGGDGATVSIQTDTGLWFDHKTREGGGWSRLIDKDHLALGDGMERPQVDVEGVQKKAATERKTRVQSARAGWDAADRLDDPVLAKIERNPMLSKRKRAAKTKSMEHIKAMRDYLESRGPGVLAAAIRAGVRALRATHKLAQGRPCVVWPIREPVLGKIEGIQREWGRGHENKKMKGLHMVPVGSDPHHKHSAGFVIPPATKGEAPPDLLFFEGPITTCAGASARPECWAVSLFDTAGIASPPRPVAERAKRKGARRMVFVCDGDAAGIKASTEGARKAQTWGLGPVFLTILPMGWDIADLLALDGICDGVDGREVVRECLERGLREVPPPEKSPTASVWSIQAWRPAADPILPAATVPVEQARAIIKTGVQMMVLDYISWLAELDERREQGTKGRLPLARPWLFKPTTGTGKTTEIKALINNAKILAAGGACLALVPDHSQADAYEAAGWWHYRGRNPDPTNPGYCPNHQAMMEAVEAHHIPQAEFCHRCPNGLKWAGKAEDLARMGYTGDKFEKLEACVWQDHLRDTLQAQFVVAPGASFSETLAGWARDGLDASGDKAMQHRMVLVDEQAMMAVAVAVGLPDIDLWSKRTDRLLKGLEAAQAKSDAVSTVTGDPAFESVQKAQAERREKIAALRAALDLFQVLASEMARMVGREGRISVAPALLDAVKNLLDKDDEDVTVWERLEFGRDGSLQVTPLRAAWAIRQTLEYGDGHIKDGRLQISGVRPIIDRIGKRPIAFFDATPDPVAVSAVRAHDGHVVQALATQAVTIIRKPNQFRGLKPFSKDAAADQKERATKQYKALRKLHSNAVLLVHKKVRDILDPDDKDELLGHWGADHRAHDRWAGKDLVICGSFFPPMHVWREAYQAARVAALSAGADSTDWPEWPDDMAMEEGVWVAEGATEVQSRLPLPTDPAIRRWLLGIITNETVQAVGRVRGANLDPSHPVTIHIYGGVPMAGLGEHGLTVDRYERDNPALGGSRANTAMDARQAIASAMTAGQRTINAIRAWVKARTGIVVGIDRVRSVMRSLEESARTSGDDIEAVFRQVAKRADSYLYQAKGDLEIAISAATAAQDWTAAEMLDLPIQAQAAPPPAMAGPGAA